MNKQKHFIDKGYICYDGYSSLEINTNGDVLPCCPDWHNHFKFGNIYQSDFNSIINSAAAKEFRKSLYDGTYKFCNPDICMASSIERKNFLNFCFDDGTLKHSVDVVRFAHDRTCNIKCITCRNGYVDTREKNKQLDSMIGTHFLPMVKGARIVHLSTNGEVFASSHCKKLISEIISAYPDVKFDITSNGILFNQENCQKLNLVGKINSVGISIPAVNNDTYNKITGSLGEENFRRLYKNMEYLVDLKKEGNINDLSVIFVVNYYNYKEMIQFAKLPLLKDNKVKIYFWEYRPWTSSDLSKEYEKMAVWKMENKEYKSFCKVINSEIFDSDNIFLPQIFMDIRNKRNKMDGFFQIIKRVFRR